MLDVGTPSCLSKRWGSLQKIVSVLSGRVLAAEDKSGRVLAAEDKSCMLPGAGSVETVIWIGVVSTVATVVLAVVTRTLNTKHKT